MFRGHNGGRLAAGSTACMIWRALRPSDYESSDDLSRFSILVSTSLHGSSIFESLITFSSTHRILDSILPWYCDCGLHFLRCASLYCLFILWRGSISSSSNSENREVSTSWTPYSICTGAFHLIDGARGVENSVLCRDPALYLKKDCARWTSHF